MSAARSELTRTIPSALVVPGIGQIRRESLEITTLDILCDAAWVFRCQDCGATVDHGVMYCDACLSDAGA